MPETLRIQIDGQMALGLIAKDLALSTDERTTLTNMTTELGGFTGIVESDDEPVRFAKARRGVDIAYGGGERDRGRLCSFEELQASM
jgi:homoaconitase/3-isopropylmalate dehydratase large subunit